METDIRRKYPPEKLNFRLGTEYIQNFYQYMEKHGGKKIDLVRDALNYWMSVDGKPETVAFQIRDLERELELQSEHLLISKKSFEEQIVFLNQIVAEKDERILLLQERIAIQDDIIKKLLKENKNEDT